MKKKVNKTFALALIVTLMSGCATTPPEVKEEIKNQEEMLSKDVEKENALVKLTSVSDVLKQTPKIWKKDSGNVRFNGVVQVPDVKELHKWKVEIANETYKNPERTRDIFLKYFDNLDEKEEEIRGPEFGAGMWSHISYIEKRETPLEDKYFRSIRMDESGGIGVSTLEMGTIGEFSEENTSRVKTYLFDMDGKCIEGGDEVLTIRKNIKTTPQERMDQMLSVAEDYEKAEPGIDIVPDRVEIWHYEDANADDMYLFGALAFDGVRVDNASIDQGNINIKSYDNTYRLSTDIWQLGIGAEAEKDHRFPVNHPYKGTEKLETYDKIIGMEDAWNLVVKKMAELKNIEFNEAELMYSVWYQPEGDTTYEWYYEMDEPPKMYATPVWRFYDGENCVYVDAVNGTVMGYEIW